MNDCTLVSPTQYAKLHIMVGVPGSGKSTYAKKYFPSNIYVSRDAIRYAFLKENDNYFDHEKETFALFVDCIVDIAKQHGHCVVDATHLNKWSRNKLTRALDNTELRNKYEITYYVMATDLETCYQRNDLRKGHENVPRDVIKDMYNKMTCPQFSEHPAIKDIWKIKNGDFDYKECDVSDLADF